MSTTAFECGNPSRIRCRDVQIPDYFQVARVAPGHCLAIGQRLNVVSGWQASETPPPPAKRRKVENSAAAPKADDRATKPGRRKAAGGAPEALEADDADEDSADELIDMGAGLTAVERRAVEQHVWALVQADRRAPAVRHG